MAHLKIMYQILYYYSYVISHIGVGKGGNTFIVHILVQILCTSLFCVKCYVIYKRRDGQFSLSYGT